MLYHIRGRTPPTRNGNKGQDWGANKIANPNHTKREKKRDSTVDLSALPGFSPAFRHAKSWIRGRQEAYFLQLGGVSAVPIGSASAQGGNPMASRTPSTIQVGLFRCSQIVDRVDKGGTFLAHPQPERCGEAKGPSSSLLGHGFC